MVCEGPRARTPVLEPLPQVEVLGPPQGVVPVWRGGGSGRSKTAAGWVGPEARQRGPRSAWAGLWHE